MTPRTLIALALGGALFTAGCTTVIREPSPTRVVYRDAPAPPREVIPPPPSTSTYWVPGHWAWDDGRWEWQRGHYVTTFVPPMPRAPREAIPVAPSRTHVWVRGHYRWRGNGWLWISGRWVL